MRKDYKAVIYLCDDIARTCFDLYSCGCTDTCKGVDISKLYMDIYRKGSEDCLLRYNAYEISDEGKVCFRWDDRAVNLPTGRYLGKIYNNDMFQFAVELVRARKPIITPVFTNQDLIPFFDPISYIKPEGITDMFDSIATLNTCLLTPLDRGQSYITLPDDAKATLCGATLCKQPQLIITDGINREVVLFLGCTPDGIEVARAQAETEQYRFPKGSQVAFVWTSYNVTTAAAGC